MNPKGIFTLVLILVAQTAQSRNTLQSDIKNVNTKLLQTIRSYMDLEENPCEDFYQYACGNWEYVHWDDKMYVDTIGSLEYQANKELTDLLEQRIAAKKRESNEVFRKVRDYYESCTEEQTFNVETYLEILKPAETKDWPQHLGEHSVSWQGKDWNWLKTLGKLRGYGLNGVFFNEKPKSINATDYIIQLDRGKNVEFNADEAQHLEALKSSPFIKDRITGEKLRMFKDKLKTLTGSFNDAHLAHDITLGELTRRVPGLDFKVYFTELLQQEVDDNTPIIVRNIAFMRKLNDLIGKTTRDTVAYYIMLKLLSHLRSQMPRSTQPHHCIQSLKEHMSLALDYIYEKEHYSFVRNETDAAILRVFNTMQTKFVDIVDEHAGELTMEERKFLKAKILKMQINIGNLPKEVDEYYYRAYYSSLQIEKHYFYWNHLNVMHHTVAREHHLLKVHSSAPEHTFFIWKYPSPAYQQMNNLLLIPYAYLQTPIFHKDYHELFLFAELGNTLGHEMMHGFDTNGLQFDAAGNPSGLFANAMQEKPHFLQSLSCLYQEATTNVNEKIADFSGLRLAYEAYFHRSHVSKFREERTLTNKQLFFIKFAQFFCAVSPNRIKYDETHDTPFKRVPQAVANYGDFAQEFGCALNTRMNPKRKCHMW